MPDSLAERNENPTTESPHGAHDARPSHHGKPGNGNKLTDGMGLPRLIARIDESFCIGCTLCIDACPYDAIVGAHKQMHIVLSDLCTGCGRCVAPCPLDCVAISVAGDGSDIWTQAHVDAARQRHLARGRRLRTERDEREARLAARTPTKSDTTPA